tara:strand:+ start:1386 stop:1637 length:252 start_codon:yes stop_codon:yes gene_type:complete
MKYLFAGSMKNEEFDHIITMTGLRSEGMKTSLKSHLVNGASEALATIGNDVSQSNFSRDLRKVEKVFSDIVKYNEIIGVQRIT